MSVYISENQREGSIYGSIQASNTGRFLQRLGKKDPYVYKKLTKNPFFYWYFYHSPVIL